jgi:glucose/mannose-6-phosphate isomerase
MTERSMRDQALDVARQLAVGLERGHAAGVGGSPTAVALAGLGGSAAGARLASALFAAELRAPVAIVDATTLPGWVDARTLVVCTSYSGATAETLALWEEAGRRGAQRAAVTAGGPLAERATAASAPLALVEEGFAPRGALGLLLGALAAMLDDAQAAPGVGDLLAQALPGLQRSIDRRSGDGTEIGTAAARLAGRTIVLYGSGPRAAAALRIKNQINENAKATAFAGTLPEIAHNEILGWIGAARHGLPSGLVLLRDPAEDALSAPLADRIGALVEGDVGVVETWTGEGATVLERTLDLLVRGDLLSLALADVDGVDPDDIARLQALKDAGATP